MEDRDILSTVDSAEARRCYATAEAERQGVFLVAEPHPILRDWLLYHARHVRTYVDADPMSDQTISADLDEFWQRSPFAARITLLNMKGPRLLDSSGADPQIIVRNSQGMDSRGKATWYWIGSEATFEVIDFAPPPGNAACEIAFDASAGLANPEPLRTVALADTDKIVQKVSFTREAAIHFQITPKRGKNVYSLKVLFPTEQTQKIPSDPRNHMLRIEHITIRRIQPTATPDNAASEIPKDPQRLWPLISKS
jgi:hypothetical protein